MPLKIHYTHTKGTQCVDMIEVVTTHKSNKSQFEIDFMKEKKIYC